MSPQPSPSSPLTQQTSSRVRPSTWTAAPPPAWACGGNKSRDRSSIGPRLTRIEIGMTMPVGKGAVRRPKRQGLKDGEKRNRQLQAGTAAVSGGERAGVGGAVIERVQTRSPAG